ncbi:MAG TPA: RuBisCO large subunit C-terminal-like domain-containing protein [Gammaproteobacteria bacterium]|nr:RuBisCO large subunit C-terminal-like domain-containing protein [Gammaproteobacteria bacterium]
MSRFHAVYHLRCAAADVDARAQALALEQSIEMPLAPVTNDYVREEIVARVEGCAEIAAGVHAVTLSLATATAGGEIGQAMNMLFGNCSLQDDVTLVDVALPDDFLAGFRGPRFGLQGMRELVGAWARAMTMTALKPQGLPPAELAALCETFARAGLDIIKDDHGIANQAYSPFAARVAACQAAVRRANAATGGRSVYAPSLSGGPRQLREQLRIVREEGVGMVLACPMLMGLACFAELVDELPCPVLAHPALGGASRIAPPLLFGRLFRLLGADATIFPNYGGRFSYSRAICEALAHAGRAPWRDFRPCTPVPAGGMSVERVAEMLEVYGRDVCLLIGGNLLAAGTELPARSRAFVDAVRRLSSAQEEKSR